MAKLSNEDLLRAIEARHSVRSYTSKPIPADVREALQAEVERANAEGSLHMSAAFDDLRAFSGAMARYGKFEGVSNYLVCAGKSASDLQERVGYYGERVVLAAQDLGLNSCWVALTYGKGAARKHVGPGEKLVCTISLGYGQTQGKPRKTKATEELCHIPDGIAAPEWFHAGVRSAQLAPTAMNQQKFRFDLLEDGRVAAKSLGGFYSGIDLGIAKLHFEIGANAAGGQINWA